MSSTKSSLENKFMEKCIHCSGLGYVESKYWARHYEWVNDHKFSTDIPEPPNNPRYVKCAYCDGKGFIPTREGGEILLFLSKMGVIK